MTALLKGVVAIGTINRLIGTKQTAPNVWPFQVLSATITIMVRHKLTSKRSKGSEDQEDQRGQCTLIQKTATAMMPSSFRKEI